MNLVVSFRALDLKCAFVSTQMNYSTMPCSKAGALLNHAPAGIPDFRKGLINDCVVDATVSLNALINVTQRPGWNP